MKKYHCWDQKGIDAQLMNILQKGGIVAGTSDTVIGLLAPITREGKNELDRIKKRTDKPYLVLVSDIRKAARFSSAIMRAPLLPLLKACWPGPLTVIVSADAQVPDYMSSATGAIALRVPDHQGLQRVLQLVDGLFSTSANITGEKVPASINELEPEIVDKIAIVLDDRVKKESKPSTIIDCTGPTMKLIREGAYPRSLLEKYIKIEK